MSYTKCKECEEDETKAEYKCPRCHIKICKDCKEKWGENCQACSPCLKKIIK